MDIVKLLNGLSCCDFEELNDENYEENILCLLDLGTYLGAAEVGVTKVVLYPLQDSNKVVKIPFQGHMENLYSGEEKTFCPFNGALYPVYWDYCRTEAEIYIKAVEANLEKFFAKTEFIGYVNGFPVYTQTKVNIFIDIYEEDDYSQELRNKTKTTCASLNARCFDACWIADFLDYYGEEAFKKLDMFLKEYGIQDLHRGNLGYLSNGAPVIVDYSDYCE